MTVVNATGIPISQLSDADVPLSGDELLVLVQDGTTKKVEASELTASGSSVLWTGVAVAALGAGPINNEATDISAVTRLALTLTGDTTLTGKTGGADGKILSITNRDAVDTLTIEPEDAGSLAANRFSINGTLIVPPGCGALFLYDGVLSRWVKQ